VTAILIAILYGVTDEIHQRFVPPRQMDPMDLGADALGATLAAGALYARRNSSRRTAAP
jgi:VanZ family protein